jgi:type IV fimbrial biogenesis protein FimT
MIQKKSLDRGFSLLELCTVLFIIAIIAGVGVPRLTLFLMREEREIVLDRLQAAIEYTKQEAFSRKKTLILCGSINHQTCHAKGWSEGFILIEPNPDPNIPKPHKILQIFPKLQYGSLKFSAFGTHLNIRPDGTTINNGTFSYCPNNKDAREADALIINKASRTYRATIRNSRGILIKNFGTPQAEALSCQ